MTLRLLYLVHGYPPRERAGTEEHTRLLAEAMAARGHEVHVVAATRAPGRRQYGWLPPERIGGVHVRRLVNNTPARPLGQAERDSAIEAQLQRVVAEVRPDVVHAQHVQFLSSGLRFDAPLALTLHDAWLWCAAGGLLLREGAQCAGPAPERCAPCAARWRPVPTPAARALMRAAGALAPVVAPERLHGLWQRLPARVRRPIAAEERPSAPEGAAAAAARNAALRAFAQRAALRLAPSRWLAARAEAAGLGPVAVQENAAPAALLPRRGGGPFLFLGTVAWHKGPDLVISAWKMAFPGGNPGLIVHGPALEPAAAAGHPLAGPLDTPGVWRALAEARALVLGSRWPENAPMVILEARAAGCPVIAPRTGGIPELVEEGRDGVLYPPGDIAALAAAMRAVADRAPGPSRPPPTVAGLALAMEDRYLELVAGRAL